MYIGQTRRNISTRAAEHMRNVKNKETEKSASVSHVWNENHRINKEPKLLKQLHRQKELNVWEKRSNSEVRPPTTRETSNHHAAAGGTSQKLGRKWRGCLSETCPR